MRGNGASPVGVNRLHVDRSEGAEALGIREVKEHMATLGPIFVRRSGKKPSTQQNGVQPHLRRRRQPLPSAQISSKIVREESEEIGWCKHSWRTITTRNSCREPGLHRAICQSFTRDRGAETRYSLKRKPTSG